MTTIFIGGSRKISRLNDALRARAKNIVKEGLSIVIGDANGADKAMQSCFAEEDYRNVVVYCSGATCRNNLGDWPTRHVESGRSSRDFLFYTAKDVAMSKEADYGLMLWDGTSVGTLHNILNLLDREKPIVVYFSFEKSFVTLRTFDDLEFLLRRCPREAISRFEQRLDLETRMGSRQGYLSLAR